MAKKTITHLIIDTSSTNEYDKAREACSRCAGPHSNRPDGPGTGKDQPMTKTPKTRKAKDDIRTPLEKMLKNYGRSAGTDLSCAIRDLLTELMHLCVDNRVDFAGRLCAARETYRQERIEFGHVDQQAPAPFDRTKELGLLDRQAQALREELGYCRPGEVIWQSRLDFDDLLVVVADGCGRASVLRVRGNYPVDYILKRKRGFATEVAACAHADSQIAISQP